MENLNLVPLWINLSRAYEIAKLGNFSIQVIFHKDYVKGYDDYKLIKSFYNDINFVSENGDIIIEICEPKEVNKKYLNRCETIEDIRHRVELAKKNMLPTELSNETSSEALIKSFFSKFPSSINKINKINHISMVIAQLGDCKRIGVEHTAEAIHYSIEDFEDMIIAESEAIQFGAISISRVGLENYDINRAIEYLQSLVK